MKSKLICIALAAAFALTACGGPKLTAVNMPQTTLEVATGETATAETSYTYDGETPENAQPEVVYTSSDESIATVDENGIITGVAEGEATITATVGDLSASRTVSVIIPVESLTAEDASLHLADGAAPLTYVVTPEQFTGALSFACADESIATVSADGLLTPVAVGDTTVTVTAPNGLTATAAVHVWDGPKALTLTPGKTEITTGSGTQIAVADEAGNEVDAESLTWTSSDESIATVAEGWVDMIGSGNVTITAATQYGVSATVDLTGEAAATSAASTTGDSNSNSAEGASDSNISLSSGALPFSMAAGTQEWFGVDFGDYICNAVVDNINQYRAAVGVAPLTCTADMSAIADSRCLAMVVNSVMSHDGNQTAEIIAQNYNSAASVVAGWANSPGHYAAMTNPNYTVCGVGCAFEESGWSYWCVTLG